VTQARLAIALALLGAACSSQTLAPPDAGGPGGVGGSPGSGGFITGDVDGVRVRGETQAVSYWWSGLLDGWLAAEGSTAEWTWMLIVKNLAGPAACSYAMLTPPGDPTKTFASYVEPDGRCDVTVTAAAPNVGDNLEGTFTATLVRGTMAKVVTNGAFRLPRIAEPPPSP
jgi:hypothetical protein